VTRLGTIEVYEEQIRISPRTAPDMSVNSLEKLLRAARAAEGALQHEGGNDSPGEAAPEPVGGSEVVDRDPPATEQVAEAPPVATPEAAVPPLPASATVDTAATCRKCGREMAGGSSFRNHERWCTGRHKGGKAGARPDVVMERPFTCEECGESFPSAQARGAHRRYKHGAGYRANDLGLQSAADKVGALRAHAAPKTKTFLCPRCNEGFLSREGRDAHEATHAPVPDPQVGLTGRRVGGPPAAVAGGGVGE
jgi:transcription elongation factor Elf1